jgi:thiaminase/transcriptional activator TenA
MFLDAVWAAAQPTLAATEGHPFLTGMVDGSLPLECFQYYILQDALYLRDFGAALRRLAAAPEGLTPAQADRLREFALETEQGEAGLHNSFFKDWGLTKEHAKPSPTTLLYTSYVLRVVTTDSLAEGLAALLPCFWVYQHIGVQLLKRREAAGATTSRPRQYDQWIDMYAGENFEQSVMDYKALVADFAAQADPATVERMAEHFRRATVLEYMFWDAAYKKERWPLE